MPGVQELHFFAKTTMKPSAEPANLDRCVLGGLFTGIVAAIVAMTFNVIYRGKTGLYDYGVITPVSIFMVYPFLNLAAGGLYILFIRHLRRPGLVFAGLMLLIMLALAFFTAYDGATGTQGKHQFRGLVVGFEIIQGILGATLTPFFVNHPTLYLTAEDMREEE